VDRKKYFVYAHYKNGSLEPFYIGKGKGNRETSVYGRNKHWKNIVNKYGYTVKIISKNLCPEEAVKQECFWIDFFGRKDLQKGELVNYTDGGDGATGRVVLEHNKRYGNKNPFYGKTHTKETSEIISSANKNRVWQESSKRKVVENNYKITDYGKKWHNGRVILNTETGIFYMSIEEAAKAHNINRDCLRARINKGNNKQFIEVT
jgi:hypothetical protein